MSAAPHPSFLPITRGIGPIDTKTGRHPCLSCMRFVWAVSTVAKKLSSKAHCQDWYQNFMDKEKAWSCSMYEREPGSDDE